MLSMSVRWGARMGFCPICKTSANEEQPTGGDYRRVDCRKCGRYQITGTALSMIGHRLAGADKNAVARLSHATKMMAMETSAEWPEINSVNLDDMLQCPLPSIRRQMTNLLVWAAAQLDDDRLGEIALPDEEDLTGVVGTVDGRRVEELVKRAANEGLIEVLPDNCIGITSKGWASLEPDPEQRTEQMSGPPFRQEASSPGRRIKAHCNRCGPLTNAWVRAEHKVSKTDGPSLWSDSYEVLECCGCENLSVRRERWVSEWDEMGYDDYGRAVTRAGIKETYFPAPTVRAKPAWSDQISDEVLRNVLDELYAALNAGLHVLSSVGARTLLDRTGHLLIGDDPRGGFEGKLSALETKGHISAQEKATLEAVADAGNASAHRGYTPTATRLGHIVDIIENFLHRSFVLRGAAEEIRRSTPARPHSK